MEMNDQILVGGRCPPAPPAPALDEWGPCPIRLGWAYVTLFLEIKLRVTPSPSNSPCSGDILTLAERVTF